MARPSSSFASLLFLLPSKSYLDFVKREDKAWIICFHIVNLEYLENLYELQAAIQPKVIQSSSYKVPLLQRYNVIKET